MPKRRGDPRKRKDAGLSGEERSLVVLFVPSVERDGVTAYPKARGVWRDDERGTLLLLVSCVALVT